jgi:hypothetical protein
MGRTSDDGGPELPMVVELAHGLPVVAARRRRGRLAELPGTVDVEEVVLRDAHG